MNQFEKLVEKFCGHHTSIRHPIPQQSQQINSQQSSGGHLHLDTLYQAISPALRVCSSKCSYHHVNLLLTELEPSYCSYVEKGAEENTSHLLEFIPTRNGQMTALEGCSLELKPTSILGKLAI